MSDETIPTPICRHCGQPIYRALTTTGTEWQHMPEFWLEAEVTDFHHPEPVDG